MIRRPLIWILGIWIFGEIVASMLGIPLYSNSPLDEVCSGESQRAKIEGTISNINKTETGARVSVDSCVVTIDDKTYEANGVLLFVDEYDGLVGDEICASGKLTPVEEPDNYGEFNSLIYYKARNIDFMFYADDISATASPKGIRRSLYQFKMRLYEAIDNIATSDEEAALYKSLAFGDKSSLPEDTYKTFKICGIAHILAVGGLHLSILGNAVLKTLKKFGVPIIIASIVSDALLLLFILMINGSASAWRAYIMFTLSLIAPRLGRTYDLLSALGVAGVLLLISSPLYALDSAFQLSFSAIFAIGVVFPRLKEIVETLRPKDERGRKKDAGKVYYKVIVPFAFSLSIQVMTFPIVARNYYTFSPYGILLNIALLPVISIVLLGIVIAALVYALLAVFLSLSSALEISSIIAGASHYFFEALLWLCEKITKLPYAEIVIGRPSNAQVCIYYLIVAAVLILSSSMSSRILPSDFMHAKFRKISTTKKPKEICDVFLKFRKFLPAALLAAPLVLLPIRSSGTNIYALYVGQGDSTVVSSNDGHAVIFDIGSSSRNNVSKSIILPFLKASAITDIDLIVLSHPDEDHINGVTGVIEDELISVHGIAIAEASSDEEKWDEIKEVCASNDIPIYLLDAGDEFNTNEMNFEVLSPSAKNTSNKISSQSAATQENTSSTYKSSSNESSLVVRLEKGNFSALFTGDITSEEESNLLSEKKLSKVSYLKSPHHGSKYSSSSEFLELISPAVTTFSAGRGNSYGHPTQEAIDRTNAVGSLIYRTDTQGMITIHINEKGIDYIETFK